MKRPQNTADDDHRVVVPGLAGFRLVSDAGHFVAPVVAKRESKVARRRRSTVVIERILTSHLTAARNGANLSQAALAKAVGRHQTFVAKIEMNRRHLQVIELLQLCAVMDQDPCELLKTVVQSEPVREVLVALMKGLRSSRALQGSSGTGNAP